MPLTRADLAGRKTVGAVHIDMARGMSAWMFGVEGIPRLGVMDESSRAHGTKRWWLVDNKRMPDLDAALAVLNGEKTVEQVMAEEKAADETPRKRSSVEGQIQEVKYELDQRKKVYDRLVRNGSLRQSEADLHTQRMEDVLNTLEWLRDNKELIQLVREELKKATVPPT